MSGMESRMFIDQQTHVRHSCRSPSHLFFHPPPHSDYACLYLSRALGKFWTSGIKDPLPRSPRDLLIIPLSYPLSTILVDKLTMFTWSNNLPALPACISSCPHPILHRTDIPIFLSGNSACSYLLLKNHYWLPAPVRKVNPQPGI